MGTYQIPRNVKGEGRILFVFSGKALMYSAIGLGIGFIFVMLFSIINLAFVGYILMAIFALLGFCIAKFKVPNTTAFEITKKTGGENIDDVLKRAINYRRKGGNVYIYKTQDEIDKELGINTEDKGGRK